MTEKEGKTQEKGNSVPYKSVEAFLSRRITQWDETIFERSWSEGEQTQESHHDTRRTLPLVAARKAEAAPLDESATANDGQTAGPSYRNES